MSEPDGRLPSESVPFKTVQIVAVALILGPLIFAAIVISGGWGQAPGDPTIGYIAGFFFASALITSLVLPTLIASQNLARLRSQKGQLTAMDFFGVYQTRTIIRAALLEGGAFFCLVANVVTHLWWTLAMAFALLAVIAIFFPTRGRFDDWVRDQRELGAFDSGTGG